MRGVSSVETVELAGGRHSLTLALGGTGRNAGADQVGFPAGQLSAALRAALTADQIRVIILEQLEALFNTDAADLSLLDPAKGEMRVAHASGLWASGLGTRTPVDLGIVGHVMATGRPYTTPQA